MIRVTGDGNEFMHVKKLACSDFRDSTDSLEVIDDETDLALRML